MILRYTLAWVALAIIAIINGLVREHSYGKKVPELAAHQLSTISGMVLSGLFVWFIHCFWPFESSAQAWTIGLIWLALTIAFEFSFGRYLAGHSWKRLFADYNLLAGRLWLLFLLWILVLPNLVYKYT